MIKKLVPDNHIVLSQQCKSFDLNTPPIDPNILKSDLIETMHHYGGVGLSANQIGLPYRVFSMIHENNDIILYNPQILQQSTQLTYEVEGCLSYPGLYVKIRRPINVYGTWYNEQGHQFQAYFSNLSCRVFLHEMDHMLGKVYYETASRFHMSEARRKRKPQLKKIKQKHYELWQNHISNLKLKRNLVKPL